MKRFILNTVAAASIALFGMSANLQAAPHGGAHAAHASRAPAHGVARAPVAHSHVASHAHVAVHAHAHAPLVHPAHVRYHVRGYRGWAWRCWFPGYRTYGYYCGDEQCWYYWYAPLNEYLPVSLHGDLPADPRGHCTGRHGPGPPWSACSAGRYDAGARSDYRPLRPRPREAGFRQLQRGTRN